VRIAFLGDSLTEGWPGASFMERLGPLLPGHSLVNLGRAGDTVANLALRILRSGFEPVDLAFIWVGVNDAFTAEWRVPSGSGHAEGDWRAWWAGELDAARRTYARLLALTLERSPLVICVPPLLPEGGVDDAVRRRVREVAAAVFETAAATSRTRLFDLQPAFTAARAQDPTAAFTIDGVHLTERGADVVAQAFAATVGDIEQRR